MVMRRAAEKFCSAMFCCFVESTENDQTIREIFGVARLVKFNRHSLAIGHFAKIFQVCANNWNSVGAGQVRDPLQPVEDE